MMRIRAIGGLVSLGFLMGASAPAAASGPGPRDIEEAGIVRGALVAGPAGGRIVPLVQGGQGRSLPVISPDGTRIAFIQATDKSVALDDLVVVARDGHELARAHIEPVIENTAYAGMRYVEAVRWISPTRVVVSGSINPSTSQYYTIDASTGAMLDDFTDDASRPAFSPDGRHVVVLGESPHFTPADERQPVLLLDGKPIWTPAKGTALAAAPAFSPDGQRIAWASRDTQGRTSLNVRDGASLHTAPLPVAPDSDVTLAWSGSRVVATASPLGVPGQARAWSADAQGRALTAQLAVDPKAAARALQRALAKDAAAAGVQDPDFWCAACSLAGLPRQSL